MLTSCSFANGGHHPPMKTTCSRPRSGQRRVAQGVAVGSRLSAPACRPLCPGLPYHGPSGHFHKRILLALILACAPIPFLRGAGPSVIQPGAKVEKLAGGFEFTEGPTADTAGNVYFTDQPNDRILNWSVEGKLSTFMQPSGRSNGLFFDSKGNLLACADENNQLWSIDPSGNVTVLVLNYQGKLLNGPNDVWVRQDGVIYFTDPFYKRPYWKRESMDQDKQCVYYLSPEHRKLTRVAEDLEQPNGITGTPDGQTLYVADIGAKKTYVYSIQKDGTLTGKRLFCLLGSDGMTLDNEGNLYLTGKGVTVFDKTGRQIEHIEINEPWTANVCFGGKDRQTLFITASKGLYAIRMAVKGSTATYGK
jgi:gluconolactonase